MNKEEAPDRANRGFFMRQSFGGDRGSVRGGCRTCGQDAKSRIQVPRHGRRCRASLALSEALSKPRNSFPPPSEAPPCASTYAQIVSTKPGLALRPKKGTLPPWFCLAANTQAAKLFAASEKERQPCCTGL